AAVRYGVGLPGASAANATIRMAWSGDERRYLQGVIGAALLIAVGALVVLSPLYLAMIGGVTTLVHTTLGVVFATTALDVLFFSYRKVPFACSYVPVENPKFAWPAGVAA